MTHPIPSSERASFEACRAAFVGFVKKDEEHTDQHCKTSLRAHWAGPENGFASDGVNSRFKDFRAGWQAARASLPAPTGWQMVPVEPAEEMLDRAGAFALMVKLSADYGWTAYMRDLWARFLSAAPSQDEGSAA